MNLFQRLMQYISNSFAFIYYFAQYSFLSLFIPISSAGLGYFLLKRFDVFTTNFLPHILKDSDFHFIFILILCMFISFFITQILGILISRIIMFINRNNKNFNIKILILVIKFFNLIYIFLLGFFFSFIFGIQSIFFELYKLNNPTLPDLQFINEKLSMILVTYSIFSAVFSLKIMTDNMLKYYQSCHNSKQII